MTKQGEIQLDDGQTDGRTDRQNTSAGVELRFAAKNKDPCSMGYRQQRAPELD